MERWINKNLKWITLVLIGLFLIKSIQSCNRGMSLTVVEKRLTEECDSIIKYKDQIINNKLLVIDSLNKELLTRDFMIKDLNTDLKIAGVKVNAAQRRADAVQRTAERVKSNTTIEIIGAKRDTTSKL